MKRYLHLVVALVLLVVALTLGVGFGGASRAKAFDPTKAPEIQERLLDGLADFELKPSGELNGSTRLQNFVPRRNDGCGSKDANNVKVNQNCLNISDTNLQGRGQAQNETSLAINPNNKSQLVASFNDYRRGDGNCYAAFSGDGGRSWGDTTPPTSFTRGAPYGAARQYWQAGGDTSVAWDTKGNAYLSCQMFMRGVPTTSNPDLSSAFFVFRSTGNAGASWNFPARPVIESPDPAGSGQTDFLDKQLMTVDNHVGSPYQDRVYVSWTTFAPDGSAYIYEAHSSDYGETFSSPVVVSSDSAMCANTYGLPTAHGRCNENQFSQPFTGPDGKLYVTWENFNNAVSGVDNRNQILVAVSSDGGSTFTAPIKVGDYYDLPDCATYQAGQDAGRACVPEKANTAHSIFRATNYPSGAVNPTNPAQVVITYGSYINSSSYEPNCVPTGFSVFGTNVYTGVKSTPGCNNKVLVSVSADSGLSFTGGAATADPRSQATVNSASQAGTDQWWQWTAFNKDGKLAVSYYDRQYGTDESTGAMDITISGSSDLAVFGQKRVTTVSMPVPTEFSGVFFGDYAGLDAVNEAHPIWADTRNVDLFVCPGTAAPGIPPANCTGTEAAGPQAGLTANDEDVYTAAIAIPTGRPDQ